MHRLFCGISTLFTELTPQRNEEGLAGMASKVIVTSPGEKGKTGDGMESVAQVGFLKWSHDSPAT